MVRKAIVQVITTTHVVTPEVEATDDHPGSPAVTEDVVSWLVREFYDAGDSIVLTGEQPTVIFADTNKGEVALGYVTPADTLIVEFEQIADTLPEHYSCDGVSLALNDAGLAWVASADARAAEQAADLARLKRETVAALYDSAEIARSRFLTTGSGQALEYYATEAQARALVAQGGGPADESKFRMLTAERDALGAVGIAVTLAEVAAIVVQQADAWDEKGAEIKRVRRSAKMRIEAASSRSEIDEILAGVVWPSPPPDVGPE